MRADEAELRRVSRVKRTERAPAPTIGAAMISFFKHSVQKRQTKFGHIGECWRTLIPEMLAEHTALDTFSRGTLTVLVDSSSHLYELRTLLLSGLQKQLLVACKSAGLRKISLKHGRWYSGEDPRERKIQFDD